MKKIINKPETLVMEMCNGMVMAHPELELLKKYKVIKKKEMNENKVTLISGGGSGHEPAHAGLVGKGMLDAEMCLLRLHKFRYIKRLKRQLVKKVRY